MNDSENGKSTSDNKNASYAHKAANICICAPILGIAIAHFALSKVADIPSLNLALLIFILVFFLIGFIAGIVALAGIRKFGPRGILWKTIAGLSITGIIVAIAIPNFFAYRNKVAQYTGEMQEMTNEAFHEYPGWMSVSDEMGATIVAFSVNDASALGRETNRWFTMNVSTMKIVVYNPEENIPLTLDIREPSFRAENDQRIEALKLNEIFETTKGDKKEVIQMLAGKALIKPGSDFGAALVFMPLRFDWSTVAALNIKINDEVISLYGEYLTPEEKTKMFQQQ